MVTPYHQAWFSYFCNARLISSNCCKKNLFVYGKVHGKWDGEIFGPLWIQIWIWNINCGFHQNWSFHILMFIGGGRRDCLQWWRSLCWTARVCLRFPFGWLVTPIIFKESQYMHHNFFWNGFLRSSHKRSKLFVLRPEGTFAFNPQSTVSVIVIKTPTPVTYVR